MTKKIFTICAIFCIAATFSLASFSFAGQANNSNQGVAKVVKLPAKAKKIKDGLYSLGHAIDKNGQVVEGYAIIKYKDNYGKPGTECGNGICEPGENANKCATDCGGGEDPAPTEDCYGYIAKEAKWRSYEPYFVNPQNNSGLDEFSLAQNLETDINKWENAASMDILGYGFVSSSTLVADLDSPDNMNEVYFGNIEEPGAIAITIVWGIFGGRPSQRQLVEWDQVYDEVDYNWSMSGEAGKMDFENIATHELGHTLGLADLYTTECSEVTMYGYADFGEINKRTLEAGDIAGISSLY